MEGEMKSWIQYSSVETLRNEDSDWEIFALG